MRSRWGIFGGTFDPFHRGHLNSLSEIFEAFELEKILIVPAHQSPFRAQLEGPGPEQRLQMVRKGIGVDERFEVVTTELDRKGISYTVDTLKELTEKNPEIDFSLILGADQFERFEEWKSYEDILKRVDLIVTSRPGFDLPEPSDELPDYLASLKDGLFSWGLALTSGKKIFWHQLSDIDISGTEIRRKLRMGESVAEWVPSEVLDYIHDEELYENLSKHIEDFIELTQFCYHFVEEKGGIRPLAYDLRDLEAPSEFTLIASGTSTRQTTSLGETLVRAVKTKYGVFPQNSEGLREGRWVVLDYGSLIIHFFYDYVREEYKLEELWRTGQLLSISGSSQSLGNRSASGETNKSE